jgi:hypothetical protein
MRNVLREGAGLTFSPFSFQALFGSVGRVSSGKVLLLAIAQ